ncbi:MAG: S9 family peptidase [Cytophagaceae bacterium]
MKKALTYCFLIIYISIFSSPITAQDKEITLREIWQTSTFQFRTVSGFRWMQDDNFYTAFSSAHDIVQYSVRTGDVASVLVRGSELIVSETGEKIVPEEYFFSPDLSMVLISTGSVKIFRHSTVADYYLFDLKNKKLARISAQGKSAYATFSPDGKNIAYVRNNNLYYTQISDMKEVAVTTDGELNKIINGASDWVYEEEFELVQAFQWSPDSKKIAYFRFDESHVPEFTLQLWQGSQEPYPANHSFKYPKAGESNSKVEVYMFHLESEQKVKALAGSNQDAYIPRIKWHPSSASLAVYHLNRLQNHLQIVLADVHTGKAGLLYEEKDKAYIEINDDFSFIGDGKQFIISSEKDGYKHLYLYSDKGMLVRQITKGTWEVDEYYGLDEKNGILYYSSTEFSSKQRHLYSIQLSGKKKTRLSSEEGFHQARFSTGFNYYIQYHSSIARPLKVTLYATGSTFSRELLNNSELEDRLKNYSFGTFEFTEFPAADGSKLNGFIIRPPDFDPGKKYPVLLTVYGGPGHQLVMNRWGNHNHFWFHLLAQKGYIVACVDGRGTGGRGADFKKMTQNQLGKYETKDVISTAKYLAGLDYIDGDRIGIFGWSFGGYLSSLAITLGADQFKLAIAVAPVTSWRFYDTIYTERFLGLPSENAAGYDNNSPITHAANLRGKYLLIHGTADDNVHIQNALEMQNALIAAGKQFDTFYYPNRNHGIYGGNTRLHLYEMMTRYILENL